jgi:hypothetical protein
MIDPKTAKLYFKPEEANVIGELVTLTDEMAEAGIHRQWWNHDDLKEHFDPPAPIDRHWHWTDIGIEYEGRYLQSEKVAVVAGDGNAVQGAMLISCDPVASVLQNGQQGLFLERLFTAPWNRKNLRQDGQDYLLGVGTELITWGAWFSREKEYGGRLLLDSSPDQVVWYQRRGLQILAREPILYEGVEYTPMELSPQAAGELLDAWEADEEVCDA